MANRRAATFVTHNCVHVIRMESIERKEHRRVSKHSTHDSIKAIRMMWHRVAASSSSSSSNQIVCKLYLQSNELELLNYIAYPLQYNKCN